GAVARIAQSARGAPVASAARACAWSRARGRPRVARVSTSRWRATADARGAAGPRWHEACASPGDASRRRPLRRLARRPPMLLAPALPRTLGTALLAGGLLLGTTPAAGAAQSAGVARNDDEG